MPAILISLLTGLVLAAAGRWAVQRRADGQLAAVVVLAVGWVLAVPAVLRGPPAAEVDEDAQLRARIAPAVAALRQVTPGAGIIDCRIAFDLDQGLLCWEGTLNPAAASLALSNELTRVGGDRVRPRCIRRERGLSCEITAILEGEDVQARVMQVPRGTGFKLYGGIAFFGLTAPLPDGTAVPVPFTPSPSPSP